MYSKDQLEAQLKAQAKNAIFERDFMIAFNKHLSEKKREKSYAEERNWEDYRLKPAFQEVKPFTIAGDDPI